jgi:hypothetical protein
MRIRYMTIRSAVVALTAGFLLAGCGTGSSYPYPIPTSLPVPTYTVNFLVHAPEDTPPGNKVVISVLDEVTGLTLNASSYEMHAIDATQWHLQLNLPRNALVHYRYSLKSGEIEGLASSGLVDYRTVLISGNSQIEDLIAHWLGTDYHGTTGRIHGLIRDAVTGLAVPGVVVSAAGMRTITDTNGTYMLSGVPSGKQTLVVFDMDGNYRPFSQEAIVADGQDTPANLQLSPAPRVTIAFHLYIPQAETPPGAQIRIVGNLLSLGNTFLPGPASTMVDPMRAPLMTPLNDGTLLASMSLPVGTYLRYKYTLGDGFWNNERDSKGHMVLHEMIVPEHDTIVENGVLSWRSGSQGPVTFNVVAPANTPANDKITIQFSPIQGIWMRPIPMWMVGPQQWTYTLVNPLEWPGPISYRYCRNGMCGVADDLATAGAQAVGRQFQINALPQATSDTILEWAAWPDTTSASIPAPSSPIRQSMRFGTIFSNTRWSPPYEGTTAELTGIHANTVFISPQWYLGANSPLPEIRYLPELESPLRQDLVNQINTLWRQKIQPAIAPDLTSLSGMTSEWWDTAPRDTAWWDAFFQEYSVFLYTYADLAQQNGVEELVIIQPAVAQALPGIPNTPSDIETRWRVLIRNLRLRYSGRLIAEVPLSDSIPAVPQFFDEVDEIMVRVSGPLTSGANSIDEMKAAAGALLDSKLADLQKLGKPLFLAPAYASLSGADAGCPKDTMGTCQSVAMLAPGSNLALTLTPDFDAQTRAYQALLMAAAEREWITGFFPWGYYAPVALRDASTSIHGKPVEIYLTGMFNR